MVSSNGGFLNRLLMSKQHRNDFAGSRLLVRIKFANVKKSFAQCEKYNLRTGTKTSASHLASSCWEEPIIDKVSLSGTFSLFF